jgi:hypothetical protein
MMNLGLQCRVLFAVSIDGLDVILRLLNTHRIAEKRAPKQRECSARNANVQMKKYARSHCSQSDPYHEIFTEIL